VTFKDLKKRVCLEASIVILIYADLAMVIFLFTDLLLVYLTIRVFGKNTKISEVSDIELHQI
jgi:hypothetical protein